MDRFITKRKLEPDKANDEIPAKLPRPIPITVLPKPSKSGPSGDLGTDKPHQPLLDYYPKNKGGRQFQSRWFKDFPWLEYSREKDRAFCYPCRLYSTQTSKSESAFAKDGFCTWSKALASNGGFRLHDKTEDHLLSCQRWKDRTNIANKKAVSIDNQLDPDRLSVVAEHREYITLLLKYHRYFLQNELAYRGRDETEESVCRGNWKEYINVQLDTNERFKELHSKITEKYKSMDYTSDFSTQDFLEAIAAVLRGDIISEINDAGMFSILIDECKDNAGHEQLSLCFRYLKDGVVNERFHSLHRSPETDAHHLVEDHIVPALKSSNISAVLVGGGADGASVMSGCHEGVFVKLLKHYSCLLYIHCAAHRLNLVVAAYLTSSPDIKVIIKTYNAIQVILNVANNREIFEAEQQNINPKKPVMSVGKLTEVRWSCKFEGVDTIIRCIKPLLISLQKIADGDSNKSDAAASSFITSLVFLHEVLAITDGLNRQLQEKEVDWVTARQELEVCKKMLEDLNIESIAKKVNDICTDVDITTEYEDPLHNTRKTLADYFKMTKTEGKTKVKDHLNRLKNRTVEKVLKDLSHRFDGMSSVLMAAINSIDAATDSYLEYDRMVPIIDHYKNHISLNETLLRAECQRAKIAVNNGHSIIPENYPNLQKIIKISKTLPVATATVERGFSCMRRIISYSRNSVTSPHASNFMLASLNKDLLAALNIDEVIDRWASKRPRYIKIK